MDKFPGTNSIRLPGPHFCLVLSPKHILDGREYEQGIGMIVP